MPLFRKTQREMPIDWLPSVGAAARFGQRFFHSCRRRQITFVDGEHPLKRRSNNLGHGCNGRAGVIFKFKNTEILKETTSPIGTTILLLLVN